MSEPLWQCVDHKHTAGSPLIGLVPATCRLSSAATGVSTVDWALSGNGRMSQLLERLCVKHFKELSLFLKTVHYPSKNGACF